MLKKQKSLNQYVCSCVLIFLSFSSLKAQEKISSDAYLVRFTDKAQSTYQLSKPDQFLSSRALQRRQNQEITLKVNDLPVCQAYIDSLKKLGFIILNASKWLNAVSVKVNNITDFQKLSGVSFVKPYTHAMFTTKSQHLQPFDEHVTSLIEKKTANFYGQSYGQIAIHHGDSLHSLGFRGQGMLIAVLDGGFNNANNMTAFDSLWLQNRVKLIRDVHDAKGNVFMEDSHGSMVLSTMASTKPGSLVGTAPMASYLLLRSEVASSEYPIEEFDWAVAAELADSIGADIITSSLGYSLFDDPSMDHTYRDMNGHSTMASIAASTASSKGMLVLVSAGNEGADAWKYITAPADADSILTVGAVNTSGVRATFSSVGPTSDKRIKPDVMAVGWNAIVQTPGNTISTANGTSFSAPIMAGLTACLWQSAPTRKNMDILNVIKQSSSQYQTPDSLMGYGIPDFVKAYALLHPMISIKDKDIIAWPSPFTSELNVTIAPIKEKTATLAIFTATGRKVFEKQIPTVSADANVILIDELAYLQKGLYVVKVFTGSRVFVCKVVKI